jgi:hypothetical protein
MRGLFTVLALAMPLMCAGCGQRLDVPQAPDRNMALLKCSARTIASARHDRHSIRAAMFRLESCMAEHRLPGHAVYDRRTRGVRYAYEADQPVLHF